MEKKTEAPMNRSSQDISTSDQIICGIATPSDEREAASGSNGTDQEKTASCIRLPAWFTTDDRSGQTKSLASTSSKMNLECKYFDLFYLSKLVL